ncbi:unnamed protein product [Paramecium sonneborni]|uniref:Uncharacterized protein n=1 Tax=Paramecium sonneborni TaxID=65129 RepID=A0A8S1RQH4_9CILI|nr:unnamed protein product [Paramecium sonneborni]
MKQLKQELEQLNQKIEKLKLENQKLKDQIEQQSNQLYFFQQQQQQYYPKKTNLSTPFLSSRNSSYQKVSFKFQGKLGIRIENDGKRAQDKGSFLTSGFVICEPSIPFNQNVKLAFLIIQNYYNIQLGICSKDKYGEMNSKYMTDDLASLQFYDNDTIVIDIRMKEKKLVFKKLRSSQHREIKIDTSQVLYPCVYLGSSSIIEIVDYN